MNLCQNCIYLKVNTIPREVPSFMLYVFKLFLLKTKDMQCHKKQKKDMYHERSLNTKNIPITIFFCFFSYSVIVFILHSTFAFN